MSEVVELIKKSLPQMTKEEVHGIFWCVVDYIIANFCTEAQRRTVAAAKVDSESSSAPHENA